MLNHGLVRSLPAKMKILLIFVNNVNFENFDPQGIFAAGGALVATQEKKKLLIPAKISWKMKLNFSRSALFHMKTKVSLKYFVTGCRLFVQIY